MTDPDVLNYTIGGIFALFIVQGASLMRDYFNSRKTDPSVAAIKSLVEGQAALTKAMTKAMDGQVALRSEVHDLHRWLNALNDSIISLNRAVERIMVVS